MSYTFTVAAIVFIYAMHALPGMVLGYCLIQFGVTWAYISGYVVSSEILPTRIRATGLGVSVAIGRLGAVIAPLMLTNVYAMSGSPSAALVVLIVLALPGRSRRACGGSTGAKRGGFRSRNAARKATRSRRWMPRRAPRDIV